MKLFEAGLKSPLTIANVEGMPHADLISAIFDRSLRRLEEIDAQHDTALTEYFKQSQQELSSSGYSTQLSHEIALAALTVALARSLLNSKREVAKALSSDVLRTQIVDLWGRAMSLEATTARVADGTCRLGSDQQAALLLRSTSREIVSQCGQLLSLCAGTASMVEWRHVRDLTELIGVPADRRLFSGLT